MRSASPLIFSGLFSLALALLLVIGLAPLRTHAAQKSCRRCECSVTQSGYVLTADVDAFFEKIMPPVMGGDKMWWTSTKPAPPYFNATMHVPRMCGNGQDFQMTRDALMHEPEKGKTVATFTCKCDKSVVCLGGSKCEDSGL